MNTKMRELVFVPIKEVPNRELPPPISRQRMAAKVAENLLKRCIERQAQNRPKRGPKARIDEYKKRAIYSADTESELDCAIAATAKVIGTNTRGNKRLGNTRLYSDLVQQFQLLKKLGITLPKGGGLSLKACQHGLIEILRRHGCLNATHTDHALKSSKARAELGHKLARIFNDICESI
jgi:hypothetical protein